MHTTVDILVHTSGTGTIGTIGMPIGLLVCTGTHCVGKK